MGASTAETPTSPDEQPALGPHAPAEHGTPGELSRAADGLRASDAERDQVVARLRDEYVAGRLSQDTFLYRVDQVLGSRHQADLPPVLADLPVVRSLASRLRASWARVTSRPDYRPPLPASQRRAATTGMASSAGSGRPLILSFPRGTSRRFSIGRDAACDLALADLTVSRRHARLERTPDGWQLTDLESTNGTRVNGWRVRGQDTVPVGPGDLVSFGDQEVIFLVEVGPSARS